MEMIEDADFNNAFRKRILAQALFHRVGKDLASDAVYRFKRAGLLQDAEPPAVPEDTASLIRDVEHPRRLPLPPGPLVVVRDGDHLGIVDAAEHLLRPEVELREAALEHFERGRDCEPAWLTPYTIHVLDEVREAILSDSETKWIAAGLTLHDATKTDLFANIAGVRQTTGIRFREGYQEFLRLVFRPPLKSLEHLRPPVWNPGEQRKEITRWIMEWSDRCDELGQALRAYFQSCGYIPLARNWSASRLVELWRQKHGDTDVWDSVWRWELTTASPLASYHACRVFIDHPEWIPPREDGRVWQKFGTIIECLATPDATDDAQAWRLLGQLARHYHYHMESLSPGLDGDLLAAFAWWIAGLVAPLFGSKAEDIRQGRENLVESELDLSARRWAVARTRIKPSALRAATLGGDSVWSASMLASVCRTWERVPASCDSARNRVAALFNVCGLLCAGELRTEGTDDAIFALEEPILALEPRPDDNAEIEEYRMTISRLIDVRHRLAQPGGVDHALDACAIDDEDGALFYAAWLRSRAFGYGTVYEGLRKRLLDANWRLKVFQKLPDAILDSMILFMTEWQLQQTDEWQVRVPHFFAHECETAEQADRRKLLFCATLLSSMNVDVFGPVERLLTGSRRVELIPEAKEWIETLTRIARVSEPWVAGRIRSMAGSISRFL